MNKTRWKTAAVLIVCLAATALALTMGGCSVVTPSDRALIHDHRLNADAINVKVQADANLPAWVREWWDAEARTWRAIDAWAAGKPFSKTETAKDGG